MYIERIISGSIVDGISHNPVVAVIGPRQCGKSTLVKHLLSTRQDIVFLDLELPSDLSKLNDPEWYFLSNKGKLICIDEIHRKPGLFPVIRSIVDQWGGNGHFIVLGSASIELLRQGSESLAGRIHFRQLTPFLWDEIKDITSLENYISSGGFPRSLLSKNTGQSYIWRSDFISTFLERDLIQWKGFTSPSMRRLWQMLAHNNGQLINYSILGSSLGVSNMTVRNYIDLLQAAFMVHVLPPYRSNTGKRIIKSPKVYITDTGITSALLGLQDFNQISGHQVFGSLWESIVLINTKAYFPGMDLFFYRSNHGAEIDIIATIGEKIIAIECKASQSPALSRGNYSAIEDINPDHTFIVAPVKEGWSFNERVAVVNLGELVLHLNNI